MKGNKVVEVAYEAAVNVYALSMVHVQRDCCEL
jgi:hypothetical protein